MPATVFQCDSCKTRFKVYREPYTGIERADCPKCEAECWYDQIVDGPVEEASDGTDRNRRGS